MLRACDTFVRLDDVQYTRRDWRNRNLISGQNGPQWLTIPVVSSGKFNDPINEIVVANRDWGRSHLSKIDAAYRTQPMYEQFRIELALAYSKAMGFGKLVEINHFLTQWLLELLKIEVTVLDSYSFPMCDSPSSRFVHICKELGAKTYLSAPAAKSYLDSSLFERANLSVAWIDYGRLPRINSWHDQNVEYSIIHTISCFGVDAAIALTSFASNIGSLTQT